MSSALLSAILDIEEALSRLILLGERSLQHALTEYVTHFHQERPHQGKGNVIFMPAVRDRQQSGGSIRCDERPTEAFDRGDKFWRYRTWFPTLTDYLLVAQDKPLIDHYHRVEQNRWELISTEGLEARLHLESIHCTLQLADVYDRLAFPTEEPGLIQDQPAGS